MAGRVDHVELVLVAIIRIVIQRHALGFNRDATLTLNIHGIENLILHFTFTETTAYLDKTISQSRFAMVNMGNNRKISDIF